MKVQTTGISGVVVIDPEPSVDHRGHFARTFDRAAFAGLGLAVDYAECATSLNLKAGTLRGLHYQAAPHEEAKLIRCTRGRVFDVAVDLREGSPSYGMFFATELSAETARMIYIPEGCAHGFQSLEDMSELSYQISVPYRPDAARGIRWDDPQLAIPWPLADPILSDRDRALPTLDALRSGRAA
jgi:dTDP-4-dehydrorhamnose 3,5-epimerase